MGTLVTLAVAVVILLVVSRLTWPRDARAPMPLYVGTIVLAFFTGSVAGSLADGRDLDRALQTAVLVSGAIAIVAFISWFRVKTPEPKEAGAEATPARPDEGARRRRR